MNRMKKTIAVIAGLLVMGVLAGGIYFYVRQRKVQEVATRISASLERYHESYQAKKYKEMVSFYEETCSLLRETQNTFMEKDFASLNESMEVDRPMIDSIKRVHQIP